MNRDQGPGFTLIELLVVCVIIVLVAGMLISGNRGSREKARRMSCLNNLKQIGLACQQYAGDSGGRLPCGATSVFSNLMLTSVYLGTTKVLICPSSAKFRVEGFTNASPTDAKNVSYSYQVSALIPTATGMIWNVNAQDVVMWDQGVAGTPGGPTGGVGLPWAATSNHKGDGGNVLFNDCHVSWNTKTPTNMTLGCQNP
jgi:prepilin-type N-terminal cleavage/methylation domain-containing protein/prepilin-type processing-associated H-X9-DG protein